MLTRTNRRACITPLSAARRRCWKYVRLRADSAGDCIKLIISATSEATRLSRFVSMISEQYWYGFVRLLDVTVLKLRWPSNDLKTFSFPISSSKLCKLAWVDPFCFGMDLRRDLTTLYFKRSCLLSVWLY